MFNTNPWLYYSTTSNKLTNTYIQGILDTSGNITLRNGGLRLPNGDVSMNGNLYVGSDTTMIGNVNIQSNLVVNKRVLQTLNNDPSYNTVNGYYALADNVQPIVSKQTAYDIGQNWRSATTFTNDVSLNAICWSPKLKLFCAVGSIYFSGTNNNRGIFTSPDGMIWTGRGNAGTYPKSVCWSQEKGIFVLGGRTGGNPRISYSSDGITWTGASGSLNSNFIQMYWIAELGIFLCVGYSAGNYYYIMISYNGSTWTTVYSFTTILTSNVCWSPELRIACTFYNNSLYIATNNTLSDFIMITTLQNPNAIIKSIAWSSEIGIFCAVSSDGSIFVSNDGYNWNNATNGIPLSSWNCICWASELGIFCVVANYSSTNEYVIISRDGYNWTKVITNIVPNSWSAICWAPEISTFCVVALAASQSGKSDRAMVLSLYNRLPTYLSIKKLLNDGNYNINIPSTNSGNFPNFGTTAATGPNLINIGNGNYQLVAATLRDSIAIGNTIINGNITGYNIIGIGNNVFPLLTSGFQNIGIGNAIATSMTTGHNNVFIGNGVATSTSSTGNTVAIGTNAGSKNITGVNNTYLGVLTGVNADGYSNSTALGYGAIITSSNQIYLGTANETINIDGNLIVSKTIQTTNLTVYGNTFTISDITLLGNLIINNTTPSYNVNSGSFQLKGGAGILGNVFIDQNLSVAQNSTFSGNVSLNGVQNTFTGDVSMNGNLQVNQISVFNGNVVINENTTFAKDVSMNANLWVGKNATVGEDVSMNGNLYVGKNSTFIGNVSISGFSTLKDVSMNGNISVSGQTTLVGNVNIQGNLVVNKRVLQTLNSDPSYNNVNGYYALADNVQPIVSKQTAYDIGQNWHTTDANNNVIFGFLWRAVCWSPKLGLFCAASNSGSGNNRIAVSSDGKTWINATSGVTNINYQGICWSAELEKFCACGTGNTIIVSSDGLNWTAATSNPVPGATQTWRRVCWSPELGIFCITANSDSTVATQRIMISRNGLVWQTATSVPSLTGWFGLCWAAELGIFCVTSNSSGTTGIIISNDGLNWRNAISVANNVVGSITGLNVCWSPELSLFCATGSQTAASDSLIVSSDGLNWLSPKTLTLFSFDTVCWSSELMMFCAASATSSSIAMSKDGFNWITISLTIGAAPNIIWCPQLSIFCIVGQNYVLTTNPLYRVPTTKSIQTLVNDGNYNINIVSTSSGTFPNFRTTATGPNLISIGNGNYKLVAGALRDSIAIGNTILNGSNPTGYGMIGMGNNVFPALTTGFQNIGIGNAIATSMTTGYNNVFIGNSVATSTTSTGNTVAIGTNAARTNTTGINNTYLGAFTNANATGYNNSTALGFGTTITASNQIKLGTSSENIDISGNLNVSGLASFIGYFKPNVVGFNFIRTGSPITGIPTTTLIQLNNASFFNGLVFNSGHIANGFFTAPITGYYLFHCDIWCPTTTGYNIVLNSSTSANGTVVGGGYTISSGYGNTSTTIVKLNANGNVKIYAVGTPSLSDVNNISNFLGFLLYAA